MKKRSVKRILKKFANPHLMGSYIKRFAKSYITLLFIVAFFELALFVREFIAPHTDPVRHYCYIADYVILFAASVGSAIFLLFQRKKENNERLIAIVIHAYALIGTLWGVSVSLIDYLGHTEFPAVYFTIIATVGGLIVLNPYLYVPFIIVSGVGLVTSMYFIDASKLDIGNIINISVLFLMIAIISFRTTAVAVSEEDQRKLLLKVSMLDVLTGLQNENAYYKFIDKLDEKVNKGEIKNYAIIVMDVNGLKHTDDTYGHRYGANLISSAGRILPKVFENSDIFHTGGDEFVCIITKEYERLDEFLLSFEKNLEFTPITFEGVELNLSLARGVARHLDGEKYSQTFQRADDDMYENKKLVKTKHNILGR